MSTDVLLQRARLLIQQNRADQAADQLRHLLSQDPSVGEAHALLALCLSHDRDQWHEATREAEQAIHLAPDDGFSHYVLAVVLQKRNRYSDALSAANEAVRLVPEAAVYHGMVASILAQQERWSEALDAATRGLGFDPDDESCSAIYSFALERLGRTHDAAAAANAAVARNPDSAESHAMRGWTLLQNGDYEGAEESFRESLRLDPTYEFARSGMIQSLNSHHFLFRMIFRFYSFLGRMGEGARWAIILGLFFGMRVLRGLARQYPALQPYVLPISMLYIAFCLLSWIADPLFNTFLRFHPFGKFLLSRKQTWASNLVASCLLLGVLGAGLQIARADFPTAIIMFIVPLFLTLPVATVFEVDEGWPLYACTASAVALGLLCIATLGLILVDGPWLAPCGLYYIGIFVFSFAGNFLKNATVRH